MTRTELFIKPLLAALAFCSPLQAETLLTADQFRAFTENTTVYFDRQGEPYGAEQYLSRSRVIWTFLDGQCQSGVWFAEGDGICFLYDGQTAAQCWHFFEAETGKSARVIGDDPAFDLKVTGQDRAPLRCPGPEVGVSYSSPSKSDP